MSNTDIITSVSTACLCLPLLPGAASVLLPQLLFLSHQLIVATVVTTA